MKHIKLVKSGLAVLMIAAFLFAGQTASAKGASGNANKNAASVTPTPTPIPDFGGIMPLDDDVTEEYF